MPPKKESERLTPLETEIMNVLWEVSPATVQTVQRLQNEGEFTVTWAKILSPLGYALNEHGVVPTICTSGLGSSEGDIAKAFRRGAEAQRKRKELDEGGWADLRKTCPASAEENAADEKIARRLLTDGTLYAKALRIEPSLAASQPPKPSPTSTTSSSPS